MEITSYEDLTLEKNSVLFKFQGEGQHIFLIKKGELITLRERDGRIYPTGVHREGDFVGVGIIASGHYFESAIARTDLEVIPLPLEDITSVASKCPGWIQSLLRTIIVRLEGGVNLLTDQRIMEGPGGLGDSYTNEDEAIYRRSLKEYL